jgi:hypothetical protein
MAGDLALTWDAVVAQIGTMQCGRSVHFWEAATQVLEKQSDIRMGILYLFVLAIAVCVGAVLGGFIGLTIGLMRAPLTYTFFGLVGGGFFGLLVGLIFVIRVHQHYWDESRRR